MTKNNTGLTVVLIGNFTAFHMRARLEFGFTVFHHNLLNWRHLTLLPVETMVMGVMLMAAMYSAPDRTLPFACNFPHGLLFWDGLEDQWLNPDDSGRTPSCTHFASSGRTA